MDDGCGQSPSACQAPLTSTVPRAATPCRTRGRTKCACFNPIGPTARQFPDPAPPPAARGRGQFQHGRRRRRDGQGRRDRREPVVRTPARRWRRPGRPGWRRCIWPPPRCGWLPSRPRRLTAPTHPVLAGRSRTRPPPSRCGCRPRPMSCSCRRCTPTRSPNSSSTTGCRPGWPAASTRPAAAIRGSRSPSAGPSPTRGRPCIMPRRCPSPGAPAISPASCSARRPPPSAARSCWPRWRCARRRRWSAARAAAPPRPTSPPPSGPV